MLPDAVPLTDDDADAWLAAGIPRWLTRQLPAALWLLASVVSVATDNTHCTPANPGVCGPDYVFAWFVVVFLATPILLFWMPLLGCAAAITFALADQRYDPVAVSRAAYAAHAAICLVVALALIRSRRAQRHLMAGRGVRTHISATRYDPGWNVVRVATVAVLVPIAIASFWWFERVSTAESRHVHRAEVVSAPVVSASSDNSTITVEVGRGRDEPTKLVLDVLDTYAYRVGGTTPVLLDAQDHTWGRLVAEPYDPTGWESLGIGAVALMALSLGRELQRRRAIRMIASRPSPCVQVQAARLADAARLLTTQSETVSFGTLLVVEPQRPDGDAGPGRPGADDASGFGEFWRGERELADLAWHDDEGLVDVPHADGGIGEPAVLVGALYDGGWCLLMTADGMLIPKRPLRLNDKPGRSWNDLLAKAPRRFRRAPEPVGDGALPGVPVQPADEAATLSLPSVARPLTTTRHLGTLYALAAFVAAPAAVLWLAENWFQRGIAVLLGGQALLAGMRRSAQRVRLSHDHLEVVGAWTTAQVPWDRLHGARCDGEVLLLAWEPDFVIELGPLELEGSSQLPEAVALSVGVTAVRLRERSLAAGNPHRQVRTRPGSARGLLATYGLLCLTALWFAL